MIMIVLFDTNKESAQSSLLFLIIADFRVCDSSSVCDEIPFDMWLKKIQRKMKSRQNSLHLPRTIWLFEDW